MPPLPQGVQERTERNRDGETQMKQIDELIDEFVEYDEPLYDITAPRTFAIAIPIAILCGVAIGFGYHLVFNSIECYTAIQGQWFCLPNEFSRYKIHIMIVTLIAGVLTGAFPYAAKLWIRDDRKRAADMEDDEP